MTVRHCWQAVDGLHARVWEDEGVIYDEFSGHTHLVTSFAAATLTQLRQQQAPLPTGYLAAQLAETLALERNEEFDAALAANLNEFERLGLVERSQT